MRHSGDASGGCTGPQLRALLCSQAPRRAAQLATTDTHTLLDGGSTQRSSGPRQRDSRGPAAGRTCMNKSSKRCRWLCSALAARASPSVCGVRRGEQSSSDGEEARRAVPGCATREPPAVWRMCMGGDPACSAAHTSAHQAATPQLLASVVHTLAACRLAISGLRVPFRATSSSPSCSSAGLLACGCTAAGVAAAAGRAATDAAAAAGCACWGATAGTGCAAGRATGCAATGAGRAAAGAAAAAAAAGRGGCAAELLPACLVAALAAF